MKKTIESTENYIIKLIITPWFPQNMYLKLTNKQNFEHLLRKNYKFTHENYFCMIIFNVLLIKFENFKKFQCCLWSLGPSLPTILFWLVLKGHFLCTILNGKNDQKCFKFFYTIFYYLFRLEHEKTSPKSCIA